MKAARLSAAVVVEAATLRSISSTFYVHIFCTKVLYAAFFNLHINREKLPKRLSYEKVELKLLMKLTPEVDFTIILRPAFTHFNPKSVKYIVKLLVFIVLFVPTHVKAAC